MADPGGRELRPILTHTFVEVYHELLSMVILLEDCWLKKGCCQLQAKV